VLANSWNESSDGKTYTFLLRNDVQYSNGDPFNAYVVWYNIYSSMLMAQGGSFIYYIYFNASGVSVGDVNSLNNPQNTPTNSTLLSIMHNSNNSVTVINATEVQFHLQQSFAPFLKFVGTSPWNFVDPYVVQQHGGVVANTANPYMNANGSAVGDGPFVVQTWVQNQFAILVSNPNYWAKNITNFGASARFLQVPPIKKIIINYKTDELTRSLDLENGKAQGATISFNDINGVLKASSQIYIPNTGLSGTLEYITLDSEKAPTNNTLVRRAIIAAVNTSQIQQSVYENYTVPFVGPVPKGVPYYNNSIPAPAYNLTLAKSLMVQAGYPDGQGFPAVSFVYPQSEYLTLVAQILVQDLSKIGITVKPQQVTISVFNSLEFSTPGNSTAAPDLAWGSFAFIPDFSGYEYIVDSNLQLEFFLNNQTVNHLVDKSNAELNPQLRAHDLTQITYAVQQNAVFIWLGQGVDDYDTGAGVGPTIWSKCVTGFWYNFGFNGVPFNALSLTC
jgi:peptide/nickel transport system substrate-binding protein